MPDTTGTTAAAAASGASADTRAAALQQFPPITRDHILNCSYDSWFPKYRTSCIKSRIVPLTPDFIEYIKEDGIVLADDDDDGDGDDDDDDVEWECGPTAAGPSRLRQDDDSDDSDSEDEAPERPPPNKRFPALHQAIADNIAECGGAVAPKLNWTSPKDAAWISPHQNTIKCETPNDVYLLLKSSNFITYDLEHAFDDCTPVAGAPGAGGARANAANFKPVLVLRSYFNPHTALEFRCFVKHRNLVAVSPRDLHFYGFLLDLRPAILARIQDFFRSTLRYTFPDGSFVFDVYIPEDAADDAPLGRVRLIDINAWAPHTDSLLFGWNELNEWPVPGPVLGTTSAAAPRGPRKQNGGDGGDDDDDDDDDTTTDDDDDDDIVVPELRLIEKDDPSAYNFSSPAYSAHKLPKDVVDASLAGQGGMREFALKWKEMVEYRDRLAAQEKGGN